MIRLVAWLRAHAQGVLWAAVAICGLGWLWTTCSKSPALPPVLITRVDSIRVTSPAVRDSLRTLTERARHATRQATQAEARSRAHLQQADSLKAVADSAANYLLFVRDSGRHTDSLAHLWQTALASRTAETVALRQVITAQDSAIVNLKAANVALDAQVILLRPRLEIVERTLFDLRDAAQKQSQCKVAYVIPCASRKQAYVMGAATGVLGVVAALVVVR